MRGANYPLMVASLLGSPQYHIQFSGPQPSCKAVAMSSIRKDLFKQNDATSHGWSIFGELMWTCNNLMPIKLKTPHTSWFSSGVMYVYTYLGPFLDCLRRREWDLDKTSGDMIFPTFIIGLNRGNKCTRKPRSWGTADDIGVYIFPLKLIVETSEVLMVNDGEHSGLLAPAPEPMSNHPGHPCHPNPTSSV